MNGEMGERSSTGAPSKASDARTPVRRRLSRDSSKSTSALRRMFTDARRTIHRSLGLNDAEAEEKKCLVLLAKLDLRHKVELCGRLNFLVLNYYRENF